MNVAQINNYKKCWWVSECGSLSWEASPYESCETNWILLRGREAAFGLRVHAQRKP